MHVFFQGWKRKVGCITLVMVCLFVAGWVRSSGAYDVFAAPFGDTVLFVENLEGRFLLSVFQLHQVHPRTKARYPQSMEWRTAEKRSGSFLIQVDRIWGKPLFQILRKTEGSGGNNIEITFLSIPYWSIVVPLTLISVWLLLSRPRPQKRPVIYA